MNEPKPLKGKKFSMSDTIFNLNYSSDTECVETKDVRSAVEWLKIENNILNSKLLKLLSDVPSIKRGEIGKLLIDMLVTNPNKAFEDVMKNEQD